MACSASDRPGPLSPQGLPAERYDAIVLPLLSPLVSLARRILRSDDLAWDAVQEALVTLWREDQVPPNPRAWLIRTVVNRSLHLVRGRTRRRKHEGLACRRRPEASCRDDPARTLERDDLVGYVTRALTTIAPGQRDVLVLRAAEDEDYETIASRLQIPVGTVRSRLNRSRRAIRVLLGTLIEE
jgi:RNA polymerase sigma-70 factor (ECF subfamily)